MALNLSPAVAETRDIAEKHGDDIVIIVRINFDTDLLKSASYRRTKTLCAIAGQLGDGIIEYMEAIVEEVERQLKKSRELKRKK